jgi:hypothetical protein
MVAASKRCRFSLTKHAFRSFEESVKLIQKQWFDSTPWESILATNQNLCQAQETAHQTKPEALAAARQLWEAPGSRAMGLPEALDICRQCCELGPFIFSNLNTFATVARALVEDWAGSLPSVEGHILSNTVGHYVAGLVQKKELLDVLRHFESRSKIPQTKKAAAQTLVAKPQAEPTAF